MTYNLSVKNNRVVLRSLHMTPNTQDHKEHEVESVIDYICFMINESRRLKCDPEELPVMCSSSMDFPEKSTKNKTTIRLARAIRGTGMIEAMQAERRKMGIGPKMTLKDRNKIVVLRDHVETGLITMRAEVERLEANLKSFNNQLEGKPYATKERSPNGVRHAKAQRPNRKHGRPARRA